MFDRNLVENFRRIYYICVSMCKYECVRRAAKRLNFREVADEDDWNVYWTDTSVGIDRVGQMKKWQVRPIQKTSFFFPFIPFYFYRKSIIFRV